MIKTSFESLLKDNTSDFAYITTSARHFPKHAAMNQTMFLTKTLKLEGCTTLSTWLYVCKRVLKLGWLVTHTWIHPLTPLRHYIWMRDLQMLIWCFVFSEGQNAEEPAAATDSQSVIKPGNYCFFTNQQNRYFVCVFENNQNPVCLVQKCSLTEFRTDSGSLPTMA